jgi:hypothetical protein
MMKWPPTSACSGRQPIISCGHTRYYMHPPDPAHDQWPTSALTSIYAATPRMASRRSTTRTQLTSTLPLNGWPPNGHHPNLADRTAGFHFNHTIDSAQQEYENDTLKHFPVLFQSSDRRFFPNFYS